MGCSVHGQHARAESAVTRRRRGSPADYPCPEQCPVLGRGGRLGSGVAAALYSISVAAGLRRCRRPGARPGRWPAWCGRGAPPGRGAARRPPPRQVRGWQGCPNGAIMPADLGADTSPSAATVRPARAGAPGTRLPEPGLQGAQLRVVQVLAQPVRLLGGQAQRVAGEGNRIAASSWASASNLSTNGRNPRVPVASISASAARIRCSPRRGSPLRASAHPWKNCALVAHCRNPCLPTSAAASVAESRTRVTALAGTGGCRSRPVQVGRPGRTGHRAAGRSRRPAR